jgi:DNA repair protein RadA/Sms
MAKNKVTYSCSNCGAKFTSWSGRCGTCGEWNTITEEREAIALSEKNAESVELSPIASLAISKQERILSKLAEFDRVLGGEDPGIVPGSVLLLAGTPGVGKSTLLLQVASSIKGTLYFSAEESMNQIYLRASRLGLTKSQLSIAAERDINRIIATIKQNRPPLVVIDSIQTVFDDSVAGTPGSLVQVRENTWRLQQLAKQLGTAILVVGHVTKEGVVAGPKVLEHLVDVVLYLEGDKQTGLRVLRAEKNRYGSTDEVGIWQITQSGLDPVKDPGALFEQLIGEEIPGRSLTITQEGTRAFVVEIQALLTKTSYGYPKRTAQGIEANRLTVLLAVLENRLELPLSQYDVYLNVVGGFSLKDPGIDLAIAAAIISGLTKKVLQPKMVFLGEIGLLGEVRPPFDNERRIKEAKRLGYIVNPKLRSVRALPVLIEKQS